MILTMSGLLGVAGASHATTVSHGGETSKTITLTGIETEWPTLDPATDSQSGADTDMLNAIYGELFEQGPKGAIEPDLATGYKFSNGNRTVTITLRKGVKFQDGTNFNAAAVLFSIDRDLNPANACHCLPEFTDVTGVTQTGPYTLQMNLKTPFAPIMSAFFGTALNWTVSPAAFQSKGVVAFGQDPIGAGPFEVVSDSASASLVLKRNPHYWEKGHPLLAGLTFIPSGSDASAYEALTAGTVQVVEGQFDPTILVEAKQAGLLIQAPGVSPINEELNTSIPPFNNIKAREAAYYATDPKLLLKTVGLNFGTVSQSPSGPGSPFFEPTVPGYRTYNLAKAKQLVQEVGGITVNLLVPSSPSTLWGEAIANEWEAAGMKVTVSLITVQQLVADFADNSWTAIDQEMGGAEPGVGINGLLDRVTTFGQFSGVKNPSLDGLVNKADQLVDVSARQKIFDQIFETISTQAYSPFIAVQPLTILVSKSLKGVQAVSGAGGLSVDWENVS
jgi:peptide/nickel transport system substrate-binding protein